MYCSLSAYSYMYSTIWQSVSFSTLEVFKNLQPPPARPAPPPCPARPTDRLTHSLPLFIHLHDYLVIIRVSPIQSITDHRQTGHPSSSQPHTTIHRSILRSCFTQKREKAYRKFKLQYGTNTATGRLHLQSPPLTQLIIFICVEQTTQMCC